VSVLADLPTPTSGPRREAAIVGHAAAERLLLESWRSGRLPHAWLLAGPKGIGKATLAFRFARAVLARDRRPGLAPPATLDVPPGHPVFARIASYGHGDLQTVERAYDEKKNRWREEIAVEDVRRLIAFFGLTASEGGYRVGIVDSCDELSRNAANALLKIVEEPPPLSLILLIAHTPGIVLPTIRSRCRLLQMAPLSESETAAVIGRQMSDLPDPERGQLARLAQGSPGRALSLAAAGGLELYRDLLTVLGTLGRLDLVQAIALADRMGRAANSEAFGALTELLTHWLAALIRGQSTGRVAGGALAEEDGTLRRLLGRGKASLWLDAWDTVTRLLATADNLALDRKQTLLNVLLILDAAARGQAAAAMPGIEARLSAASGSV
jgi:DNA polymerase III subunit delta'